MSVITLLSDFGTADHYVACMKGVILQRAPTAQIVDITHTIQPQDVVHGAFVLRQVFEYFPPGTIHIAVVDPGVGTKRRIMAARYGNQTILAPDNGLMTFIHRDFVLDELRTIENSRLYQNEVSNTFHGRDIFAPVAGHLWQGMLMEKVGPIARQLELLNIDRPKSLERGGLEGQVLYVDHFGNVISNISAADLRGVRAPLERLNVHVGPLRIGNLHTTYSDVKPGEIVAVIGSTGMLEIAVNQGNAASHLRAAPGTIVVVR
ncbi:MAG: SAM-dependent chlorinase/fluorinase [Phycisphaerales bacterium]|nr:SAM-dependent chlorinase/fluorinase [Phycisphaerales bacterium]MCB9855218.1 SAM-dependent chlorinase/fluorinase [Phycisphaerales bacterium]MCB9862811.1 SAM-dependent chlorinase/fluorinase [Phycisphaerales bacterium]